MFVCTHQPQDKQRTFVVEKAQEPEPASDPEEQQKETPAQVPITTGKQKHTAGKSTMSLIPYVMLKLV